MAENVDRREPKCNSSASRRICALTRNATNVHICCVSGEAPVLLRLVTIPYQHEDDPSTCESSWQPGRSLARPFHHLSARAGSLIYGVGRDAAYAAVHRGGIPTLRLGKSVRVLTHAALRDVGLTDEHVAKVLGIDVPGDDGDAA